MWIDVLIGLFTGVASSVVNHYETKKDIAELVARISELEIYYNDFFVNNGIKDSDFDNFLCRNKEQINKFIDMMTDIYRINVSPSLRRIFKNKYIAKIGLCLLQEKKYINEKNYSDFKNCFDKIIEYKNKLR